MVVVVLVVGIAIPHSWLASLVGCSRLEVVSSSLPVTALMRVLLLEVEIA